MAESWVRLWAGTTTDPKFRTIARKCGRPVAEVLAVFMHLMLEANDAEDRGSIEASCAEDIASALDLDDEAVLAILAAMDGRVTDDGRLSGWERRQPVREDVGDEKTGALSAAERKRLQREREREREKGDVSRNVTHGHDVSRDVTACHAPEAEAEAEAEAEQIPNTRSASSENPRAATEAGRVCRLMREIGLSDANPGDPDLLALLDAGAADAEFLGAASTAVGKGKGIRYALGIVKGQRIEAARAGSAMHRGPMPRASPPPDRKSRQLETAGFLTGAARPQGLPNTHPETIDVAVRILPA